MKTLSIIMYSVIVVILATVFPRELYAQGTAITYQGRLLANGAPVSGNFYMTFTLYPQSTGGTPLGQISTNYITISETNGLFTTTIDFGPGAYAGTFQSNFWLEIGVQGNSDTNFSTLTPRQWITATPFAITAENLASVTGNNSLNSNPFDYDTIGGGYSNAVGNAFATIGGGTFNLATNIGGTVGGGSHNTNLEQYATISGGFGNIDSGQYYGVIGGGEYNSNSAFEAGTIGGGEHNANSGLGGTIAGGQNNTNFGFDGTIAGGEFNTVLFGSATVGGGDHNTNSGGATTIGGGSGNYITNNDGTIGGGLNNYLNSQNGFIGGGQINTNTGNFAVIGGGSHNVVDGQSATIGGGIANNATNLYSTISGGSNNKSFGFAAAVGGGEGNSASGNDATIGGGSGNTVSGYNATVPGGQNNSASGDYSLAAGKNASAAHAGAFVWSDGSAGTFSSTAANQFSVRAAGGVVLAADVQLAGGATTYHNLSMSGGNSAGFLYGSYPALGDGIHLGYNFYDDNAGGSHVPNSGGGTSRISAGYSEIQLATGGVDATPVVRLDISTTAVTVENATFNGGTSDRNAKQDFADVNPAQILDKVVHLPVTEWSYKFEIDRRHIGPMAQDFKAAFNIGTDDRHIAPVDEGGIALAAIQGLNQKLDQKDAEIRELKANVAELKKLVQSLAEKR